MSTWIHRLALSSWRGRRRVVAAWVVVLLALGALAGTIGGRFDDDFRIPGASSQEALDQLKMTFPEAAMGSATIVLLAPPDAKVTDPAVREAVDRSRAEIERIEWVALAQSPYNEYVSGLISDDATAALVSVRVSGYSASTFTDAQRAELVQAGERLQASLPGSTVHVGGDLFSVDMPRLTPIEGIGVAVAIIVLVLVLGSLWAALMPIVIALAGAGASILLIVAASGIVPINSTTLMLALMLALAVGIDYSLLIVSRHRDQLATGMDAEASAAQATATAGSAVVFAGLTVVIALVGLGLAGIPFLATMGIFAAVAVAIEVALALTLLPAMLGFAGERLRPRPRPADKPAPRFNPSRWWVGVVTKVPLLTVALVVAALSALTIPAQHLALALPNSGRNAPSAPDRVTFDVISERFGVGYNGPLVITGSIVESTDPLGLLADLKADVEHVPGVKMVSMAVPNPNADTALIQVIPETGPDDPRTRTLVENLRALTPGWQAEHHVTMAVTGFTAVAIDVSTRLADALLPFGIFVVGLSLLLLTIVFRSILVPIKAALGYLLSVGAAFGLVALVFNLGIGKEIIHLQEAQPVISFLPIILMGILFGLAMDYEVFLTSRMREEYVHGNHTNPTEEGFVHSAKVVVAAAVIMVAVFAFFVPEGVGTIKPIAFGLAVGVAIDAFLVRMTLGPAVMRLLRGKAWWLPRSLERRLPVLDAEGEAVTQQLALADWPEGPQRAVYGEGLGAVTDRVTLFSGVDLDVLPGRTLVVEGAAPARRALLLAVAGRLTLTDGRLKVLDLVLAQQAGRVRRSAVWVEGTDPEAESLLHRRHSPLVVVDDADRLKGPAREALARLIADATTTVVVGAASAGGVPGLPNAVTALPSPVGGSDTAENTTPPPPDHAAPGASTRPHGTDRALIGGNS